MQDLYKGLGLQSNLEEKILAANTDIKKFTQVYGIYYTHFYSS